jgi:hypothetical protein
VSSEAGLGSNRDRKRWMSFSSRSVKAAVELEKERLILSSMLWPEL